MTKRLQQMGNFFATMFNRLWGSKEMRILILGLDGKCVVVVGSLLGVLKVVLLFRGFEE